MLFSTPKYRNATDPIDGKRLAWNIHPDGFPIRDGDSPQLVRKEQLDHATYNFFWRSVIFKIPEQIKEYNEIRDWIVNTPGVVAFERVRENADDAASWVVWLGWTEIRGVIPQIPRVI